MNLEQYKEILQRRQSGELYRHSLGAAETAARLAELYHEDRDRAYLAGLIHDYAKELNPALLLQKAEQLNLPLDPVTRIEGLKLLHAPVGAALVSAELGIDDPGILSAVAYHTTGRAGMTLLEKIIYLADFIEPNRDFPGVERLRELSGKGLDTAILAAVNDTIALVLQRDLMLHPDSVNLRNRIIARIREQKNGG
jgi:predicted HD superfamily hydrolase involved in NAD metabolism